jgi:hypothetical protein
MYAVVIGLGTPCRTKRGDWMVSLGLVDDSLQVSAEQVQVLGMNIFAKDKIRLPDVKCCGDVLRIHRAKLQWWNDELQIMGQKATSYLVFRKNTNDNDTDLSCVVSSPSRKCSVKKGDETRFPELWNWGQKRIYSHPTVKSDNLWTLADSQYFGTSLTGSTIEDEGRDLSVMVTAIIKGSPDASANGRPIGFLRVWDGTGSTPYDPYPIAESAQNIVLKEGDPPPAAIAKLCEIVAQLRKTRQGDLLTPEAVAGRVANVAIWEEPLWELIQLTLKPGSFLRLRNVQEKELPGGGMKCLNAHSKSHLTPLPDMTYEVVHLIEGECLIRSVFFLQKQNHCLNSCYY